MKHLGGPADLRFVEIVQHDIRYRVSPRHDKTLAASLDRRLARFVEAHLKKISRPRMVLHEPDAVISLPHLTLSNLQTLVSHSENRSQLAMVRFTEISGNPQSVLRASVENVTSSIQDVALNAFEHVFQSGLALTEASNAVDRTAEDRPELHRGRKRLEENIETLLFNLSILKRHVSRTEPMLLARDMSEGPSHAPSRLTGT
ncbi:MAG: hypothetical protein AAF700_10250 [Pseudomonadota bacterium]